ncbi:MAG: prepilin-type N-terminal cleavage/methylation domain-containing protein [Bdellovibrionota bacterium]
MKTNQDGFTLIEVMVAAGIFMVTAMFASSLIVESLSFSGSMEREGNRARVVQQVVNNSTSPRAMEASLGHGPTTIPCVADPSVLCNEVLPTNFSMVPNRTVANMPMGAGRDGLQVTNANGDGYYRDSGVPCLAGEEVNGTNCPIRVKTTYSVACSSEPGARNKCPASQAAVVVSYRVEPNMAAATPPAVSQYFAPIVGQKTLKLGALYSASMVDDKGVAVRRITITDKQYQSLMGGSYSKVCPPGQLMVGINPDGTVICKMAESTCARGQIFTGYVRDASDNFVVNCADTTCTGGHVFNGIDPLTGNAICTPINGSNISCNPRVAGSPNYTTNQFMTGFDQAGMAPVCKQLACPPGKIVGCWNNGNVQCVDTSFIPAGAFSAPPTMPAPANSYYDSVQVALGYEGYPFITQWNQGEPVQGYRMTYKDYGGSLGGSNPFWSGLFGDSRGSGQLVNGSCALEPGGQGGPTNLKITHSWQVVTGTYDVPDPIPSTCDSSDGVTCGCAPGDPGDPMAVPPIAPTPAPPCGPIDNTPPDYYPDNTHRDIASYTEECDLSVSGTSVTANCPTGPSGVGCATFNSGSTGGNNCDNYYGGVLRASCNYYYNKGASLCGAPPGPPGAATSGPPAPPPPPVVTTTTTMPLSYADVTLQSFGYVYVVLPMPWPIGDVSINSISSTCNKKGGMCIPGVSYRWTGNLLEATGGCRANFRVYPLGQTAPASELKMDPRGCTQNKNFINTGPP